MSDADLPVIDLSDDENENWLRTVRRRQEAEAEMKAHVPALSLFHWRHVGAAVVVDARRLRLARPDCRRR